MGMVQGMASRCREALERWGWQRESSNARCSDGAGGCVVLWENPSWGKGLLLQNPTPFPRALAKGQE